MPWQTIKKAASGAASATSDLISSQKRYGKEAKGLEKTVGQLGDASVVTASELAGATDSLKRASGQMGGIAGLVDKYSVQTTDVIREQIRGTRLMAGSVDEVQANIARLKDNAVEYQKSSGLAYSESAAFMVKLGHSLDLARKSQVDYTTSIDILRDRAHIGATALHELRGSVTANVAEAAGEITGVEDSWTPVIDKAREVGGKVRDTVQDWGEKAVDVVYNIADEWGAQVTTAEEAERAARNAENAYFDTLAAVTRVSGASMDTMTSLQQQLLNLRLGMDVGEANEINKLIGGAAEQLGLNGELAAQTLMTNADTLIGINEDSREEFASKLLKSAAMFQEAGYDMGKYTKDLVGSTGADSMQKAAELAAWSGGDFSQILSDMQKAQMFGDTDAINRLQNAVKEGASRSFEASGLTGDINDILTAYGKGELSPDQEALVAQQLAISEEIRKGMAGGVGGLSTLEAAGLQRKDPLAIFGATAETAAHDITAATDKEIRAKADSIRSIDEQQNQLEGSLRGLMSATDEYEQLMRDAILFQGVLNDVVGELWEGIKSVLNPLNLLAIGAIAAYQALDKLGVIGFLGDAFSFLGDVIGTVIDVFQSLFGALNDFGEWIGETIGEAWEDVTGANMAESARGRGIESHDAYGQAVRGEISVEEAIATFEGELARRTAEYNEEMDKINWFGRRSDMRDVMGDDLEIIRDMITQLKDGDRMARMQAKHAADVAAEENAGEITGSSPTAMTGPQRSVPESGSPKKPTLTAFQQNRPGSIGGGAPAPTHLEHESFSARASDSKLLAEQNRIAQTSMFALENIEKALNHGGGVADPFWSV